jgi:hypothetical protein
MTQYAPRLGAPVCAGIVKRRPVAFAVALRCDLASAAIVG